jgi:ABC-type branched-subunit amino acid transport system permease subunit
MLFKIVIVLLLVMLYAIFALSLGKTVGFCGRGEPKDLA